MGQIRSALVCFGITSLLYSPHLSASFAGDCYRLLAEMRAELIQTSRLSRAERAFTRANRKVQEAQIRLWWFRRQNSYGELNEQLNLNREAILELRGPRGFEDGYDLLKQIYDGRKRITELSADDKHLAYHAYLRRLLQWRHLELDIRYAEMNFAVMSEELQALTDNRHIFREMVRMRNRIGQDTVALRERLRTLSETTANFQAEYLDQQMTLMMQREHLLIEKEELDRIAQKWTSAGESRRYYLHLSYPYHREADRAVLNFPDPTGP